MTQPSQIAIGSYIAQADHGGTATVSVYEVAVSPPPSESAIADGRRLLAELPTAYTPEPGALPAYSRVILARNSLFTGRADELRWLSLHLGSADGTQTVVLAGLGGVGKTQLASEFVHRYGRFYAGGVFWLGLADPSSVDTEIASCGGAAGMQLRPDFGVLSVSDQVRLVRAAWQSALPRLLVLDNCDDVTAFLAVRPTAGGCRILVTSRRSVWEPALGVDVHELDVLPLPDASSLLDQYRSAATHVDEVAYGSIATELGQLPLALHLAGSYLRKYRGVLTPAMYLDQLRHSPVVDHRSLTAAGISPTDHIQSIAATFALSIDKLTTDKPEDELSRRCLIEASYLAPGEPIPRLLLRAALELSESMDDDLSLEDAVQRLSELGLIQLDLHGTPRLHRLVAAFARSHLGSADQQEKVEQSLLSSLTPRMFKDSDLTRATYEPHLRVVTDRALPRHDVIAADLSNLLGLLLHRRYGQDQGIRYAAEAVHIKEEIFGRNWPGLAKDLNDLGYVHLGTPKREEGRPYLERARLLWDRERDPLNLAATLDNLGQLHLAAGRLSLAEPLFGEALDIRERILGHNHYSTSVTLANMAEVARIRGNLPETIKLLQQVTEIRDSLEGQIDPATAAVSHNGLAAALDTIGDDVSAGQHFARAAELYSASLGPTNPRTLSASMQSALIAARHGKFSEVEKLMESAGALLDGLSRAQYSASWSAADLNNVGFAFWLRGDYKTARNMYGMSIERDGASAATINNLGVIEERTGNYAKACAYYRQALDLLEAQSDEPLRARVLNNLGVSLALGGDVPAGRERLDQALAIRLSFQGKGPDYAVTLRNLGLVAQLEGKLSDARELLEAGRDLLDGTDPTEYARTMHLLGELLSATADDTAAFEALETARDVRFDVLGENHPDSALTLKAIAVVLERLGRNSEACDALQQAFPILSARLGPDHFWTLEVEADLARCS